MELLEGKWEQRPQRVNQVILNDRMLGRGPAERSDQMSGRWKKSYRFGTTESRCVPECACSCSCGRLTDGRVKSWARLDSMNFRGFILKFIKNFWRMCYVVRISKFTIWIRNCGDLGGLLGYDADDLLNVKFEIMVKVPLWDRGSAIKFLANISLRVEA